MKNPYVWQIQQANGDEYTNTSDGYTLQEAIQKYNDVDKVTFNPIDKKFPTFSFKMKPEREIIFGVYHLRNIQEWFAVKKTDPRPPDYLYYQIIGWLDKQTNRRTVVGIDLMTGEVRLQGE